MTYEHEITFNDGEIYYVTSTTDHLNTDDCDFLTESLGLDWYIHLKSINTYKLNTTDIG